MSNDKQIVTFVMAKNIERGRNSSCYIALCAKSVGNFTTVTDRQLVGFGNLWFYTFIKDICLEKCYSIYLVKIIQQSIHKMWKNNNIILQLNQWKLCVGYPQTVHDPSCCWQHKSCYSNILLVCLSWVMEIIVSAPLNERQISKWVSAPLNELQISKW